MAMNSSRDKLLFTPGPLTTSATVKSAALRDLGSRDESFVGIVRDIRERVVRLATASPDGYTCVLMQGSGTFGIESVIGSVISKQGKLLVAVNGAYGRRMMRIAEVLGIKTSSVEGPEDRGIDVEAVMKVVRRDRWITHVAVCHVETTSGVINDIEQLGQGVRDRNRVFIVDGMSSFGGIPMDAHKAHIDFLVTSANKCVEGIPGFGVVVARTAALLACEGRARSVSLDLVEQYRGLESNGQFRFTPPTHAILAFHQALNELDAEGGVAGRHGRYSNNHRALCDEMAAMGFEFYVGQDARSPIITSFRYPAQPKFKFETFYRGLSERGFVIYPGKVSDADCFRIGTIGRIDESNVRGLCAAIRAVLVSMGLPVPLRGGM